MCSLFHVQDINGHNYEVIKSRMQSEFQYVCYIQDMHSTCTSYMYFLNICMMNFERPCFFHQAMHINMHL